MADLFDERLRKRRVVAIAAATIVVGATCMLLPIIDDPDLDSIEETNMTTETRKRPPLSLEKRRHGKKTRHVDVVMEMISEMNKKLDSLSELIDPMSFGKMLQEALMKTTGFSSRYLDVALGILRKDPVEGELFLLRSEENRKHMLESMRQQIGDI